MNNLLKPAIKIRILILQKGLSGAEIGRQMGLSRSYISHVIAGRVKADRVRKHIAEILGTQVKDLWPDNKNKRAA